MAQPACITICVYQCMTGWKRACKGYSRRLWDYFFAEHFSRCAAIFWYTKPHNKYNPKHLCLNLSLENWSSPDGSWPGGWCSTTYWVSIRSWWSSLPKISWKALSTQMWETAELSRARLEETALRLRADTICALLFPVVHMVNIVPSL